MTATPLPRPRSSSEISGEGHTPEEHLRRVLRHATAVLGDLAHLPPHAVDDRLEHRLRLAMERYARHVRSTDGPNVVVAVRTACAFLHGGCFEDAYLALQTATDVMRPPASP